ncbi:LOW QUALITY PROTEIN: hypothetical protein Fmac_022554 [Flemingia macrophylla]|uniref:AAA+ ATPase domain-containing protein n=1 Tax=Flemingia macrophylla TaxID=520843 RepID=A0ABD1M020_9FABA
MEAGSDGAALVKGGVRVKKKENTSQKIDESKFIDDLVKEIFNKVSPKDLSSNEFVGIYGTGGIGKTTLAKALYDSIYKNFQGSSFILNVRETSKQSNGLEFLQRSLLANILEDNEINVKSKEEGIRTIKDRLCLKRVLIVLDDISNIEQLNNLAGERNWFGLGSRIIITTRNKHLLNGGVEKRYEMKFLDNQESLELFCHCAFKQSYSKPNYEDMSNRAVHSCKGLPLALKVLGFHMVGRQLDEWKDAPDTFEKSPHEDVQRVLRISYDSLPIN